MKDTLKEGLCLTQDKTVNSTDSAKHLGSGTLEVFATPAMIAFMENTAMNCVAEHLEDTEDTVGIEINSTHSKASKIGANIRCTAKITKIEGKKIFFEIEAEDDNAQIGKASHIRYVINPEKFMSRL